MTDVLKYDGAPSDVLAILVSILDRDGEGLTLKQPDQSVDELSVVVVESMPIAMVQHVDSDQFKVTHLACYSVIHGTHPKFSSIKKEKTGSDCPMCGGCGWLDVGVGREEARTGAAFAVSMGIFRGVLLPRTDELRDLQSVVVEKAFSMVLKHPLVDAALPGGQNVADSNKR